MAKRMIQRLTALAAVDGWLESMWRQLKCRALPAMLRGSENIA